MAEATSERLARLLALVAYLADRDDVPVAELAEHFGVPPAQIMRDVDTLWVSGTPGYQPDDLLDFSADSYDSQRITLTNARGMDRPLRLGPGEAVALIVALRAMANLPGLGSDPALSSALAKLTAAAGDAATAAEAVAIAPADGADPALDAHVARVLGVARAALAAGERVHLRYTDASDRTTERDVDPLELLSDGEAWFLRGWCLLADGVRHFRLDRIGVVAATGVAVEPHDVGATSGRVRPEASALRATLTLTPRSRWVAERFGGDVVREGERDIDVELDVADEAWLARLVLDLGPDVLALAPAHVADAIAVRAASALAAYGEVS
ncbi:WYL domain-containing protein [Serinibacter arcticus]|uniref:WYL domain-containing protein n=1 Tax=Serinibacter arcticus TaxID=1655435 RepID=A0A2U1ZRU7_9MICO|nr:WYL domain-containing protein [Serinibacter arcticus]PWD49715.1 WYL domain-containing protein [Serinibacter arcticus]